MAPRHWEADIVAADGGTVHDYADTLTIEHINT